MKISHQQVTNSNRLQAKSIRPEGPMSQGIHTLPGDTVTLRSSANTAAASSAPKFAGGFFSRLLGESEPTIDSLARTGGDMETLLAMLRKGNEDRDRHDSWDHNKTPIMKALENGHYDQARLLAAFGVKLEKATDDNEATTGGVDELDRSGNCALDYISNSTETGKKLRQELKDIRLLWINTRLQHGVTGIQKYCLDLVAGKSPDPRAKKYQPK